MTFVFGGSQRTLRPDRHCTITAVAHSYSRSLGFKSCRNRKLPVACAYINIYAMVSSTRLDLDLTLSLGTKAIQTFHMLNWALAMVTIK